MIPLKVARILFKEPPTQEDKRHPCEVMYSLFTVFSTSDVP